MTVMPRNPHAFTPAMAPAASGLDHPGSPRPGRFSRVRHVVAAIYERALDHRTLQRHFKSVDMPKLIDHQTRMLADIMDGNHAFDNETSYRAQAQPGITAQDLEEMGVILRRTLEDFGYPPVEADHVCNALARRRHLVDVA